MARFCGNGLSGDPRTRGKAPTAAIRKLAVHGADLSPVRIVALPEADDNGLASAIMAPIACNFAALTSSKSS